MSPSLAERRRRRPSEEGFSLVEIMIALTIFAIVAIATAPLLIGGLKAGRAAQLNLQGKALAQERLELMRNLPYHVARQNGQYLDVLDLYFRDLQPTGTLATNDVCSARSYDAATATYSCSITGLGADYAVFRQVVKATFLDFQRNTVVPRPGYTSQTAGADTPASSLLGVAVTTSWTQAGKSSSYTLRSQIANSQADASSIKAGLRAAALTITSEVTGGDILQFEGGLVSGEGSLTTGSTANLNVTAARAGYASGLSVAGAGISVSAPPFESGTSPSETVGLKLGGTCDFSCFGQTAVTGNQDASVGSGLPQVSRSSSPAVGALRRTGSNTYRGFTYGNVSLAGAAPSLRLSGPMVSGGVGGTSDVLSGSGWLDATGTGSTSVRANAAGAVNVLELFPTSFAPQGIVRIVLTSASLTCSSGGGTGAVTATWSGVLSYWRQTGGTSAAPTGGYVDRVLQPGGAALPALSTLVLRADTDANGTVVGGSDVPLSNWVQAWAAMTDAAQAVTSSGRRASGSISAIVSLLTAPTRGAAAPTSAINLSVGALKCDAEDNR